MKLNPDCIRDILLQMEAAPYGEEMESSQLYDALENYSYDEIDYAIIKMNEAGFINAKIENWVDGTTDITLFDITYNGHQFLANIRSNSIWHNVMEVSKKIGSNSISALSEIATSVVTEIIRAQLGLS